MILNYGEVIATLTTSMVTKTANKLCLFGEDGYIEIPEFWRADGCTLFNKDSAIVESFDDKRTSHGFIYQMQHATDRILNSEIESNIISHNRSKEIQEIMTEVRRQIGLQYPMEL
jgi:hypothetical protein